MKILLTLLLLRKINNMNRKKIFIGIAILLVLIIAWSFWANYQSKFQKLVINMPSGSTIDFYRIVGDEGIKKDKSYTFTKSGSYGLRKGDYTYSAKPADQKYADVNGNVSLTKESAKINIEYKNYNDKKLQEMLVSELPAITSSMKQKYPSQMNSYEIKYGKLYITGDWFGGKLVNSKDSEADKLQVVLHKNNGKWELVTVPNISLSKDVYPDIPASVLEELNNITRDN